MTEVEEQAVTGATDETVAYIQNADGSYTALPPGAVDENGQLLVDLSELGLENVDGSEMVVITADENVDMAQIESLIQSGQYQAVEGDEGAEFIQANGLEGAQVVELTQEQLQFLDPETKSLLTSQGFISTDGTIIQLAQNVSGTIYRCPSCPAQYANANAFTKHMREKHFVKVYTCRQCEEFFETLSQLFLHARRSHVDPRKPKRNPANYKFHCDQCTYMTNNGGTMEHHKRAHTGEKPFVCDVCGKRFAQKANMKTHRNRHIHRDKIFRCDTCNKAFSSYDIYLAHLRTREHELREHFAMMASSQLSLECLGCTATFDSIYNLNKHTRSCRIVRTLQTKFRCLPCNAYVSDVAALKAHVKAHEGSQIISCPVCGERGFPGFNQLNHHITRAHALKVNRRHVCRYCESTFEVKKDLDSHIKQMHSEERNARQSRGAVGRLKCRYPNCEFTTNSIMLLDRHHENHSRNEEMGLNGENDEYNDQIAGNRKRPGPKIKFASGSKSKMPSKRGRKSRDFDENASDDSIIASSDEEDDQRPSTSDEEDEYDLSEDEDNSSNESDKEDKEAAAIVEDDDNITRRTITLFKTKSKKRTKTVGDLKPRSGMKKEMRLERKMTRTRRLPSWYRDYDTDFAQNEEIDREYIKSQLPPGIELEDPEDIKPDVPTEEWNIVVYDDEDDEDEDDEEIIDANGDGAAEEVLVPN
ncbi:hypothetical protein Ciccas_006648 [Cichlidogyrus casuarinus]|uniref:C2H2-type domain-containing protein n=1 Tax=Cichlidogyrus casuarinus TaxID=1844966 RepID=A0ABD2Q581_9PLAT